MKLKTRLIISFVTVMILPVILSLAVIAGFATLQLRMIEKNYGINDADYKVFTNPINTLNEVTEQTFHQLSITTNRDTEQMEDMLYLEDIDKELNTINSYLVVRKNDQIAFSGENLTEQVWGKLPEYGAESSSSENGTYFGGDLQILVKQVDFQYKDGAKGSAFIVTDVNDAIPEVRHFMADMVFMVVIILALTAGLLIIWIYRGVAVPLGRMKIATQNIKEGNLDFELEVETDDEIGQLCRDFEEMRIRLKESTSEKVEYDKRSKELISNISHDLKTPITAIKGYVEGIMDGVADTPEKMERYIRTIYNKANDMDMLINELTLYSKIDSNRIPYNFNTILVSDYFDDCAMDLKMDLEARHIQFDY
ncbi:MAG: HAMP domain-containing sensor histidine kinase, partial [Faecalimonas sp.]|nr:HAMP domain-containing sensor histidine kinase [Faecalimonas sp.]